MPKNQMFCTRHIFFGDVGDLGILKSHINPHSIPIQTNKTCYKVYIIYQTIQFFAINANFFALNVIFFWGRWGFGDFKIPYKSRFKLTKPQNLKNGSICNLYISI